MNLFATSFSSIQFRIKIATSCKSNPYRDELMSPSRHGLVTYLIKGITLVES